MEGAAMVGQTSESGQRSFRTAASRFASNAGEAAASPPVAVDEKIFVAVPQEPKHGMSTLVWALNNLIKVGSMSRIVIAHVHSPAKMIPSPMRLGTIVPCSKMSPEELQTSRQYERAMVEKKLNEYALRCRQAQVSCDKVCIQNGDIAEGILELIALNGITKLVMGAAADKNYSKKMKAPTSNTALRIKEKAAPSCKIWFTCKGVLIAIREARAQVSAGPSSPAACHTGLIPPLSISSQMDLGRSQTDLVCSSSQRTGDALPQPFEQLDTYLDDKTRAPINSEDFSIDLSKSQNSDYGTSPDGDAASASGIAVVVNDDLIEGGTCTQISTYSSYEHISSSSHQLDTLNEMLTEIKFLKKEIDQECNKRRNAERELYSAVQKIKELENSYIHQLKQRRTLEEIHARQRQEMEGLRRQQDESHAALCNANEQKLTLEQRIREIELHVKDNEDRLAANKYQLEVLQADYEKMIHERDAALREAAELRERIQQGILSPYEAVNTEFSLLELQQATKLFDPTLKIGGGGFGSVYKGFLRNTTVAIKLLHPESMQGQSEFHQEASVLGTVRHPHLVALIGTCPESFALVYEFCPNGSLEDRLACKNNTPPLTWQTRTRIIGEICSALIFLHSNKPHTVVHGDLKPDNILLDANFSSKLGDFGICRLLMPANTCSTTLYRTTNPRGTLSYMDPEILTTGELTPRSDVYSFGITILRLLTGKQPQRIAEIVEDAIEKNNLHSIIDPTAGDWPFVQANQLAHIGLRCAQLSRRRRPDLTVDVWKVVEPLTKTASMTARPLSCTNPTDDTCIPSYFICPILQETMSDPHVAADGFTYEREAIKGWLDSGHSTSPMTNLKLEHHLLVPNRALRSAILEWQQQ